MLRGGSLSAETTTTDKKPRKIVGTCVLCGNRRKLTNEDVIPQWLMRHAFPHPKKITSTRGSSREEYAANLRVGRTGQRVKVTALCEVCNNRWLSRVENRVKPKLLAWMSGLHGPMAVPDQQLVAFWATKTALMAQLAYAPSRRVIPQRFYRELHAARDHPPEGVFVWLGMVGSKLPGISFSVRSIGRQLASLGATEAFQADLRVHRLYIRVSGVEPPDVLSDIAMMPSASTTLYRVWPVETFLLDDPTAAARLRQRGRAVWVEG